MSPTTTTSTIVAETSSGYHHLKIDGYASLKGLPVGERLSSCPFTVGGHRWRINYYPNGDCPESTGHVSIYLVLDEDVAKEVTTQFRFGFKVKKRALFFLGRKDKPALPTTTAHSFPSQGTCGFTKFVQLSALERSKYLKDDSFTIRCDIVVVNRVRITGSAKEEAPPKFVNVPPSDLGQHHCGLLRTGSGRAADVVFEVGGWWPDIRRAPLGAHGPVASLRRRALWIDGGG
jgi:speckle-type POZ protein